MLHSNRIKAHWLLVVAEIVLFITAIISAYLSESHEWSTFAIISVIATLLFSILKILEAIPYARELIVKEDMASKIALSAERYGVREYFNMQSSRDQTLRNESTQKEIGKANYLWLCANSGTSYLDPSIYRHWQFIERKLSSGIEFRVVLLDPYSKEKAFRNQINVNGDDFDSKINIANLIKLYNSYQSLDIRFIQHGMHITVFATENCLFFDPYQVGIVGDRIENRSFCLRIEPSNPNEGVGLYRLFKAHFDTLWRSSLSFEDWMNVSSEKLPVGLPKLKSR